MRASPDVADGASPAPAATAPESKHRLPALRPGLVCRPRLVTELVASDAALVLVSAPAGFGKSTLLAQWAALDPRRFAYASLEASDNDPLALWACIVDSMRRVEPDFGESVQPMLRSMGGLAVGALVRRLLLDFEALDEPVVLVLDDYHLVRDRSCHESIELLITHEVPQLHVVLATRFDRPVRLGRIRASGQLLELRGRDLAFTAEEARDLLDEALHPPLTTDQVAVLHDRTEGWPAGLRLAAVGLRATADRDASLRSFGGSSRHILDYLTEVVLASLSQPVRDFLVDTSGLPRLTGPLCDAVTGRTDGAEMLRELERQNVFLIPLDDERLSYRYHHLFADLLGQELAATDREHRDELHRRAYRWLAAEGDVEQAIAHAVRAGDLDVAVDLVVSHWTPYLSRGRVATVEAWLDAFPAGYVETSASLCITRAYACGIRGHQAEARLAAEQALAAEDTGQPMPDGAERVEHSVALVRALLAWVDVAGQQEAARALDDVRAEFTPTFRAGATFATGFGHFLRGDHERALPVLEHAAVLAADSATWVTEMDALGIAAQALLALGRPDRAEHLARRATDRAAAHGLIDLPHAGYHLGTLGAAIARSGRVEEADPLLALGIERFGEWNLLLGAHLRMMRAPVRRRLGDAEGARALLDDARSRLARCGEAGFIGRLLPELERSLTTSHRRGDDRTELTDRELDVLRLLATGLSKRDIASELFLSFNTIHSHTRSIYTRLDVSSRHEAIDRARSLHLI